MAAREVEVLLEQADAQLRLVDWRAAIELLRRALTIDPDHARAHAMLTLLGARRLAGAEIEHRRALLLDGNDPFCHRAAADLELLEKVLYWGWLGFCAYTWVAPGLFKRMLERDLGSVVLDPDR